ncbi:MAG: N-acetyltransferase [Coriobacteriaceae bacterium]|nr:N-acetyltransferase [Coriobacteriaceae bacterium]
MELRRIGAGDAVAGFASGDDDLDRYLKRFAWFNQCRRFSVTYVAVDEGVIAGYLTVAAAQVERDDLPESLTADKPAYPLPALRVARLAVDRRYRGRGLGRELMRAAFVRASELSELAGCVGVLVDAVPHATGFYEKLGFLTLATLEGRSPVRPRPVPMFLTLAVADATSSAERD